MKDTATPQHYWFYDQLYIFNFRLVWPVDETSLKKYIDDEFPNQDPPFVIEKDFGGKALFVPNGGKGSTYIVALCKWQGNADDHANLAHECLHIAGMILENRGVEVTLSNDEALAYLTSYLVRQCLNVLLPKRLQVVVDPNVKPKRR